MISINESLMKKEFNCFHPFFLLRRRAAPIWVALILLVSVFVLITTVGAQIESQAVKTLEFSAIRECPDGIELRLPSRVVLQHIDGVFHKWEEYDLGGKGAFCIFLRKPEQRRLSTGEAKTLLENSTRWREQAPAAGVREVLDPDDPRLLAPPAAPKLPDDFQIKNAPPSLEPDKPAPPAYPCQENRSDVSPERAPLSKPEDVIEADTRSRVTNTESYPYYTVGYINNTYASDNRFRGTGFIVSPYMVLTNGHMIYSKDEGGYAKKIDFSPAQGQRFEGGEVIRPYGTRSASSWQTNEKYIDALTNDPSAQFNYDYAAVFFDTSFSSVGINTYMPLVFDAAAAGTIDLAGYPAAVQGEGNSRAMWHSSGIVLSEADLILYYDADTSGGNSGSPLWQYFPDPALMRVIAVHAFGAVRFNGGPRLVTQNQALIQSWVEWAPPAPSGGGGGRSCFIATAAYGSYLDPHVQVLRDFRDRYLLGYKLGQKLVKLYYQKSPPIAETIAKSEVLRLITRGCLMPVVGVAYLAVSFGVIITVLVITIGVLMPVPASIIIMRKHQAHSL
jgi:V8-like Glu-specific endopeptidase